MVDKNEMRIAFSSRLHSALDDAGVRARGRGVDVQKALKRYGVIKTTQAISKWLNGDTIPEADSMTALCAWLEARREWLEYGVGPKHGPAENEHVGRAMAQGVPEVRRVPLLSWTEAVGYLGGARLTVSHQWIACPVEISGSGFALAVQGDSMTGVNHGRSYPNGTIIFIDPSLAVSTGDSVIACVPGSNQLTFKILSEDAGRQFLTPLNKIQICGKVIGSFRHE